MSQEILKPTGGSLGAWTGFVSNIDETWPNGDGSTIKATTEGATALLDFSNVVDIKDYDTVNNVFVAFRIKSTWLYEITRPNPSVLFTLLVNGQRQSYFRQTIWQDSNYITGQATGYLVDWHQDWNVNQINAFQLEIVAESDQFVDIDIDIINLFINYTEPPPISREPGDLPLNLYRYAPRAIVDHRTKPGIDSLSLSSSAFTLFRQDYLFPPPKDLVLSGKDRDPLVRWYGKPSIDALSLSGKAPTSTRRWYRALSAENLALSGKAPSVQSGYYRTPSTVNLLLQTEQPNIDDDERLMPRTRMFLASDAPEVKLSIAPLAAADQLSLTGFAPLPGELQQAAATALSLAGFAPTFDYNLSVFAGGLSLAGVAPSAGVQLGRVELALAGFAPVVATGIVPGAEALSLRSVAPSTTRTDIVTVPTGGVSLTGKAWSFYFSTVLLPGDHKLISVTTRRAIEHIATPTEVIE